MTGSLCNEVGIDSVRLIRYFAYSLTGLILIVLLLTIARDEHGSIFCDPTRPMTRAF